MNKTIDAFTIKIDPDKVDEVMDSFERAESYDTHFSLIPLTAGQLSV